MEQSSTSTIKLPNKELVGVKKEKDLTKEDSNKLNWRFKKRRSINVRST